MEARSNVQVNPMQQRRLQGSARSEQARIRRWTLLPDNEQCQTESSNSCQCICSSSSASASMCHLLAIPRSIMEQDCSNRRGRNQAKWWRTSLPQMMNSNWQKCVFCQLTLLLQFQWMQCICVAPQGSVRSQEAIQTCLNQKGGKESTSRSRKPKKAIKW